MVKYFIFFIFLLPFSLISYEFLATVDRTQIHEGESFQLNLTLKDTSPLENPNLENLKQTFSINSQHRSSNTTFRNGQVSSSITWKISLTPKREGDFLIPSFWITTQEGMLSTEPIKMQVLKGKKDQKESLFEPSLEVDFPHSQPYKNESFFYTVKILSKADLANVKMDKVQVENALVQANEQPKIYKKLLNGVKINVIEFNFLITPLKAGTLTVPPIEVSGEILVKRKLGSFFDEDMDSFFGMPGFDQLKSFTLTSKEAHLQVQPPISDKEPWLPAKFLKIEEIWDDSQNLQEGEPFTRGFKIEAEGLMSTLLPSLNTFQGDNLSFKIYADKPKIKDEISDGNLFSSREEQYTFIPKKSGALTLPEISIEWWNVEKNEKMLAYIPSKTLQILPTVAIAESEEFSPKKEKMILKEKDPIPYILLACVASMLLIAILWGVILQKKIAKLTEKPKELNKEKPSPKPLPKKSKKETLPDLNPT